jgi:hypothetical protein
MNFNLIWNSQIPDAAAVGADVTNSVEVVQGGFDVWGGFHVGDGIYVNSGVDLDSEANVKGSVEVENGAASQKLQQTLLGLSLPL